MVLEENPSLPTHSIHRVPASALNPGVTTLGKVAKSLKIGEFNSLTDTVTASVHKGTVVFICLCYCIIPWIFALNLSLCFSHSMHTTLLSI